MKLTLFSLFLLITPSVAYAYLDPISLSYISTVVIGFIAFILRYITNFFFNFNYVKKFHLVNLLLINTPFVQFVSLNLNKGEYVNYFYLLLINIFFVSFYFIFFLILRKVFLKSYKDILFIGSVLFLFQFQFLVDYFQWTHLIF